MTNPFTEANREANQHYSCAAYRWKLKRDEDTVQTYSHGDNSDRFRTQALTLGDYGVTLDVDSNTTNVGGSFSRTFMEDAKPAGSSISPASAALSFRVGTDDDIIRDHMVGTWDVYHDGAYRVGGPYEDNTYGNCPTVIEGVSFSNYFYPQEITVNLSLVSAPAYRVSLSPDGTGTFAFYNLDTSVADWQSTCPQTLAPASSIRWSVSNGIVRWAGRRGFLTRQRVLEKGVGGSYMDVNDWDFATGTANGDR